MYFNETDGGCKSGGNGVGILLRNVDTRGKRAARNKSLNARTQAVLTSASTSRGTRSIGELLISNRFNF